MIYLMTEAEQQLAQIIWANEPLGSGNLVTLAAKQLGWKKSTTYTVLRKLCENDIFQNQNSTVSACMTKEEYTRQKGERYLNENYGGSLPKFVAAFMNQKRLKKKDIEELTQLIENYQEEDIS